MLYTKNHITLSYDLLGGELKDVPLEIVHTMITYSCKEGNTVETAIRGLSKKINAFPQHGGFLWNNTSEGTNLWSRILEYKQYGLYLDTHPIDKGTYIVEETDTFPWIRSGMSGELVSKIIRNISLLNREIWKEMLITNSDISSLFDWSKTPEGDMFWRKVYNEHYCGLSKTYTETKIRITKNNKTSINNEDQLQRTKSIVRGGDVPEGDILYGKKSKSSVTSGSLSFRKCLGR